MGSIINLGCHFIDMDVDESNNGLTLGEIQLSNIKIKKKSNNCDRISLLDKDGNIVVRAKKIF